MTVSVVHKVEEKCGEEELKSVYENLQYNAEVTSSNRRGGNHARAKYMDFDIEKSVA